MILHDSGNRQIVFTVLCEDMKATTQKSVFWTHASVFLLFCQLPKYLHTYFEVLQGKKKKDVKYVKVFKVEHHVAVSNTHVMYCICINVCLRIVSVTSYYSGTFE